MTANKPTPNQRPGSLSRKNLEFLAGSNGSDSAWNSQDFAERQRAIAAQLLAAGVPVPARWRPSR